MRRASDVDIVVATDGSEAASRGVDHALAIAETWDATVHALTVMPVPDGCATALPSAGRDRSDRRGQALVLSVAARALDRDLCAETAVRYGRPHRVIASYADEVDANLIVLGGREDADYQGSMASRVATATDRNVAPM
ncbi:universal stress protein [Halobacteriales archaeon QH_7_66_36]|nr:MAG: universal stress protein [Halobacteriales archaeon QH_7_66_36]